MGVAVQILSSSIICGLCLCTGLTFAWPSSTLRLFGSARTPLHRVMSGAELALFGSLSSIGALVGTPPVSLLLDYIGRKNTAILFSVMNVLSWAIIASCRSVEVVLSAVFVSGLSGTGFLLSPVYAGEVCQESIRGAMASVALVFYISGMLVSYALGGALDYESMVYANLGITVAVTAALVLLKESPTHLMAKGLEKEAAKSIAFYRTVKTTSKEVEEEMKVIRQSLHPEMDDAVPSSEEDKLKEEAQSNKKIGLWKFIKRSRSTRRALLVTVVLMTASIFQGMVVVEVYAEPLFEEALPGAGGGGGMSANRASILLAAVGVVAGLGASVLTEKAGRRPLMIYASLLNGLSCVLLGLQLQLHWGPSWLVAVNIYFFTVMYSFGGGAVPYVLLAEVFLPQVKSVLSMVVVEWSWVCSYVILFIFNPLLKSVGLGPVFYIFGAACLFAALFSWAYLPETKGLTVYEIQGKFVKRENRVAA